MFVIQSAVWEEHMSLLKKRINYLCKKESITYKELVKGLVATTHFSNILAGRYPLPDEVAKSIAKRLNVSKEYIIESENIKLFSDELKCNIFGTICSDEEQQMLN